jgi:transposase-like protein
VARTPLRPIPPPAGYVWIDEAARRIGVAKNTLYKWRQTNVGPRGVPFGRKIAYLITDLNAHIEATYKAATEDNPEMRPAEPRSRAAA